jgi:SAM-dependent methyltransferase
LDLCCGEGKESILFAENGYEVFSLDSSEEAIRSLDRKISKKHIHSILFDISKHLEFEDCYFDIIFAQLSLHYFDDATVTRYSESSGVF